ncbi:hypothetical protein DFH07DRAFT_965314 [Mycena maculata]|uniref:Uncharacterized protein n=1 Tax=Mycena maculata TaxID=230809 RepID=A0AAD7N0L7_9AGAR|nr:hypothetical protein DFH07DRAFT_965314 [Mycena maculata]
MSSHKIHQPVSIDYHFKHACVPGFSSTSSHLVLSPSALINGLIIPGLVLTVLVLFAFAFRLLIYAMISDMVFAATMFPAANEPAPGCAFSVFTGMIVGVFLPSRARPISVLDLHLGKKTANTELAKLEDVYTYALRTFLYACLAETGPFFIRAVVALGRPCGEVSQTSLTCIGTETQMASVQSTNSRQALLDRHEAWPTARRARLE